MMMFDFFWYKNTLCLLFPTCSVFISANWERSLISGNGYRQKFGNNFVIPYDETSHPQFCRMGSHLANVAQNISIARARNVKYIAIFLIY